MNKILKLAETLLINLDHTQMLKLFKKLNLLIPVNAFEPIEGGCDAGLQLGGDGVGLVRKILQKIRFQLREEMIWSLGRV